MTNKILFRKNFFFLALYIPSVWLLRKLWESIETENFDISCECLEGFGPMALRRASSCFFNKLKLNLNLNPNLNNVAHRNLSAGTFLHTFLILFFFDFFFIAYLVFGY
jgi:hypothetical protein